jgi:hypothetical protein
MVGSSKRPGVGQERGRKLEAERLETGLDRFEKCGAHSFFEQTEKEQRKLTSRDGRDDGVEESFRKRQRRGFVLRT